MTKAVHGLSESLEPHLSNRPAPCRTYVLAVVLELGQNLLLLSVLNVGLVVLQYGAVVGAMTVVCAGFLSRIFCKFIRPLLMEKVVDLVPVMLGVETQQ